MALLPEDINKQATQEARKGLFSGLGLDGGMESGDLIKMMLVQQAMRGFAGKGNDPLLNMTGSLLPLLMMLKDKNAVADKLTRPIPKPPTEQPMGADTVPLSAPLINGTDGGPADMLPMEEQIPLRGTYQIPGAAPGIKHAPQLDMSGGNLFNDPMSQQIANFAPNTPWSAKDEMMRQMGLLGSMGGMA